KRSDEWRARAEPHPPTPSPIDSAGEEERSRKPAAGRLLGEVFVADQTNGGDEDDRADRAADDAADQPDIAEPLQVEGAQDDAADETADQAKDDDVQPILAGIAAHDAHRDITGGGPEDGRDGQ